MKSLDFPGHFLADPPQLSDTLPGFDQYLVLHADAVLEPPWPTPQHKLVMPVGCVAIVGSVEVKRVLVEVDASLSARVPYVALVQHHQLQELRAPSTAARLQLAALYAATDTSGVPEPRAGMLVSW